MSFSSNFPLEIETVNFLTWNLAIPDFQNLSDKSWSILAVAFVDLFAFYIVDYCSL